HVGPLQRRRGAVMGNYLDSTNHTLDIVDESKLGEELQVAADLTDGVVGDAPGILARLEIDDVDLEAGPGEDMADAAPHAPGAERDDLHCSFLFSSSFDRDARPSPSSVRPSLRRSLPSTAEPSASRPRATGHGTPAHSHTETRNASPCPTSSRM